MRCSDRSNVQPVAVGTVTRRTADLVRQEMLLVEGYVRAVIFYKIIEHLFKYSDIISSYLNRCSSICFWLNTITH